MQKANNNKTRTRGALGARRRGYGLGAPGATLERRAEVPYALQLRLLCGFLCSEYRTLSRVYTQTNTPE